MRNPKETGPAYLSQIFFQRRQKNSGYSMRAFARDLSIPVSRMSEILNGKRAISKRMVSHLVERLALSPREAREYFGAQIGDPKMESDSSYEYSQIQEDLFSVVTDWYHFAILNLMDTEDFVPDAAWIGKRLGLETSIVRFAIIRLERVNLLKIADGKWSKLAMNVATSDQIPSRALRVAHRQVLEKAISSLDEIPVAMRDISNVSMAIDPANIGAAKAEIKRFRRRIARLLEQGDRREVFNLNIQFLPVTKLRNLVLK